MGRHAAGRQGRGLFRSVKGGQEEKLGSGDEEPSVGDKNGRGGDVGALEILPDLIYMYSGLDMTAP